MMQQFKKYEAYKDSGFGWLGEIPTHWHVKKLKYLTSKIIDGTHFTPNYQDTGVPFLRVTDLKSTKIDLKNVKRISEKEHLALIKRAKPTKGDILLSKNGTIGKMKVVNWDWDFSIFVSICLIRPRKELSANYFFYFFQSDIVNEQINEGSKTTSVTNLHLEKIKELVIGLPDVEEQTQIANFLNGKTQQIDHYIALKEKTIALLEERKAAIINQAVTKGLDPNTEMKPSGVEWLGDIPKHWEVSKAKFVSKIFVPERAKPELNQKQDGIPWLTTDLLRKEKIDLNDIKFFVSDKAAKETGSRSIPKGSVLATCVGTFGLATHIDFDCIVNQQIQGYYDIKINPLYLTYLVRLSEIYFKNNATQTTIMYVNKDIFGNLPICFPNLQEQIAIVNYIEERTKKINQNITTAQKQITLIKEYRQSLISAAVTGKIDIRQHKNDYEVVKYE